MLVTQLCLTLCDSEDCSPPVPSVHGILQARIQKGIAMPSSRGSSQPRDGIQVSRLAGGLLSEPLGKPNQGEWVAYSFSQGSTWPRNQTGVFCIAGGFFTSWATREPLRGTSYIELEYTLKFLASSPVHQIKLSHLENTCFCFMSQITYYFF